MLSRETSVIVDANKLITEESIVFQVNNKFGEYVGDIELFQHGLEDFELLEASILDSNNKKIRPIKKKEVSVRSSIEDHELYSDNYIHSFSLKSNNYPYKILLRYRKVSKQFITIAHWSPCYLFNIPTEQASLKVEVPKQFEIFSYSSPDIKYIRHEDENTIQHTWSSSSIPSYSREKWSPPLHEVIPKVIINPKHFDYEVSGTCDSWNGFGKWQYDLLEGLDILPAYEVEKVHQLTKDLIEPKDKISALYEYLQQNHRYIYVGVESSRMKPYSATHVTENRFGDCKGLTNYMKALLKEAGINSYYTSIYAGENPVRINENITGPQFNHVLLFVPLEKDTVWLENTSNYLPPNYISTFTQNRYALISDDNESHLVKTPALNLENVRQELELEASMISLDTVLADFKYTLRGKEFESMSYYLSNGNQKDQTKYLRSILSIPNSELEAWKMGKQDFEKIEIEGTLVLTNWTRKLGNSSLIYIPPLSLTELEAPAERRLPVRINYPESRKDTISIKFDAIPVRRIVAPENLSINSRFGSFQVESVSEDNKIIFMREFRLNSNDYSLEDYPEFYSFINQISEAQNQLFVLFEPAP